jgi:hypothetical protein
MRVAPIKDPQLKASYLNALYERDDGHPMNLGFDAIQDFKGVRPVKKIQFFQQLSIKNDHNSI